MLVLSRKPDEEIVITTPSGERIVVTLVAIRGDKCRLGVTAEKSIAVHRRETQEKVDALARLASERMGG